MIKLVLYPFAILYNLITGIRNYLYHIGILQSFNFNVNVIAIGNLTVGGTGKTPHVEYLIRLLKEYYKLATLNRGYGRKTKGFIIANETSSAHTLGDEPFQYYTKFGNEITVSVGEDRVMAINTLLYIKQDLSVILLDDAYQHRSVRPLLSILLSDFNRPFYNDILLPAGRLREARKGAERADVIVVSKCPLNLSLTDQLSIEKEVIKYSNPGTPIFFSGIKYGRPILFSGTEMDMKEFKILLVTGLANPKPLEEYCNEHYIVSKHLEYPDHYNYTNSDVVTIIAELGKLNKEGKHIIVTTEKDKVKLNNLIFRELLINILIVYIPIEIYFLKDEIKFNELVVQKGIK